jgi:hypothetical protein
VRFLIEAQTTLTTIRTMDEITDQPQVLPYDPTPNDSSGELLEWFRSGNPTDPSSSAHLTLLQTAVVCAYEISVATSKGRVPSPLSSPRWWTLSAMEVVNVGVRNVRQRLKLVQCNMIREELIESRTRNGRQAPLPVHGVSRSTSAHITYLTQALQSAASWMATADSPAPTTYHRF